MSVEAIRSRGIQADTLLRDDLLQEALKQVKYAAHRAFEAAKGDAVKLQRASDLLESAGQFVLFLRLAIEQGQAAARQIDSEMQAGRAKRAIRSLVRNRNAREDDAPWSAAG